MLALTRAARPAAALGLVLALHAAAAAWLLERSALAPPRALPEATAPVASLWVRLLSEPAAPAEPAPLLSAEPPQAAPSFAPLDPIAPAVSATEPPPVPATAATTHFFTTPEVDLPARPLAGWQLDGEGLAALGLRRLVFDAWTDADGRLLRVALREAEPDVLGLHGGGGAALEQLLQATPMAAAVRAGRAAAHVQRVEWSWQP